MMRVKSSIDRPISILIWGVVIILVSSAIFVPSNKLLYGIISGIVIAFLIWLYFGTYYELREDYLYCKSGPINEKIPYDSIKSIKLSENMLSSMALSRKRIEIRQHGKGYITGTTLISPKNREEFLEELKKRCRDLD